jgi:hypothetical protein
MKIISVKIKDFLLERLFRLKVAVTQLLVLLRQPMRQAKAGSGRTKRLLCSSLEHQLDRFF